MSQAVDEVNRIRDAVRSLKEEMSSLTMNYHELREIEMILNRTLMLLEKATGSKELQQAINMMQRAVSAIRMLQFTIHAFYAATGPIGWAFAISGFAVTAFNLAEWYVETMK